MAFLFGGRRINEKIYDIFICFGIFLGLLGIANATPVVYTDEASWLTAVSGSAVLTETFESSPAGPLPFGTTDIGIFDITTNEYNVNVGIFSGQLTGGIHLDEDLTMVFSDFAFAPIYGFAGDWESTTTGDLLTMEVNGTVIEFDNYLSGYYGNGFLGIVDTAPFSSITFGTEFITYVGEGFNLDNVMIATTAPVPRPATIFLLGTGLIGLAGWGRKKFRKR